MADNIDYSKLNADVAAFALGVKYKLVAKWQSLDRNTETKRRQAKGQWSNYKKNESVLSQKVVKTYGVASAVRLIFAAYSVFVEKGVGRNYTIEEVRGGAVKWKGYGEGPRKPQLWYRPVLESEVPKLASLVAESYADLSVKVTKI